MPIISLIELVNWNLISFQRLNDLMLEVFLEHTFDGAGDSLYCLMVRDSNSFYSGGKGNYIVEWNTHNLGTCKAVTSIGSKAFCMEQIPPLSHLLIGQSSGGIHVIDLENKKEIRLLQGHTGIVFQLHYIPEKQILVSTGGDGCLGIWSLPEYKLIHQQFIAKGNCRVAKNFGSQLFVGGGNGAVYEFDLDEFHLKRSVQAHKDEFSVTSLEIIPEKNVLISGSRDAHLTKLDLSDFSITAKIPAHNFAIYGIAYNSELDLYATSSMDKTIKFWRTNELKPLIRIDNKSGGHKSSINGLYWLNTNSLLTYSDDRTIKLWKILM
ncbi:MAG: hypothetical protein MRY83_04975 [Flavobacteriales bacterium]|nr:hypothetical protein [Flavobacteriales bacterium]